jgi:hypothetical protein
MKNKILNNTFLVGALLTLTGAILALFEVNYAAYVFSAGVACVVVVRCVTIYTQRSSANDVRVRRFHNLQFITTLVLVCSAYFMFTNNNLWVVALLIYALITLFLSFREK